MVVAVGCGTVAVAVGVAGVIVMTRRLIENNKAWPVFWSSLFSYSQVRHRDGRNICVCSKKERKKWKKKYKESRKPLFKIFQRLLNQEKLVRNSFRTGKVKNISKKQPNFSKFYFTWNAKLFGGIISGKAIDDSVIIFFFFLICLLFLSIFFIFLLCGYVLITCTRLQLSKRSKL